jgi:hypothetical protein
MLSRRVVEGIGAELLKVDLRMRDAGQGHQNRKHEG